MNIGFFNEFETTETSKLFKYSVDTHSMLSSLTGVQEGDLAHVLNSTGVWPLRKISGLWQYKSGVWEYASKDLQDRLIMHQAEIDANESAIALNDIDIANLQALKLDRGGYTGTGQDLKNEIDSKLNTGGYTGTGQDLADAIANIQSYNYEEKWITFNPVQANAWHTLGSNFPNKILTISCFSTANNRWAGVREENSTLDRRFILNRRSPFTLKVNSGPNGLIQVYAQNVNQVSFTITSIE